MRDSKKMGEKGALKEEKKKALSLTISGAEGPSSQSLNGTTPSSHKRLYLVLKNKYREKWKERRMETERKSRSKPLSQASGSEIKQRALTLGAVVYYCK